MSDMNPGVSSGGGSTPSASSGPKQADEITERGASLSGTVFSDSRTKYLHSQRKFSADQMAGAESLTVEALAEKVIPLLRTDKFTQILAANLVEFARVHGTKSSNGSWISRIASDPEFPTKLQACVVKVAEELVPVLVREAAGGFLHREDLHVEALLQRKKPSKAAISAFLQETLGLNDAQKGIAAGEITPVIKNAIGQTVLLSGLTTDARTSRMVYAEMQHLAGAFGTSSHVRGRLAARFANAPISDAIAHFDAVAALPVVPTLPSQAQYQSRLDQRFRRTLAMLAFDPDSAMQKLPSDGAHTKLCQVFDRLWKTPGIAIYLNYFGNEGEVMARVMEGIRRGRMELCCISCPDYSGSVKALPNGKSQWEFDFRSLGDGTGVVARKGFRYVQAWVEALKPVIPEISVTHIMPTFEVPNGFKARVPEGVLSPEASSEAILSREVAVSRITRSGEAIAEQYRAMGIQVTPIISDAIVSDALFVERRMQLAERMRADSATDPRLHGLLTRIFDSRRALYDSWQARLPGEDDRAFAQRMVKDVVPNHAAEYCLAGAMVTGRSPTTLLLSYDSAIMNENYGIHGIPAMYGYDTAQTDYVGAAD